eukprot:SAG31_NODE_2220_length_6157_cov_4.078244_11_plen_202_part_00
MVYGLQDLQVYRSYDEAWLVPVLFPLAPAVILNMVLLYALVRQRCCSSSSVARASCPPEDKAAAGILGFDCVFSICCLAQCIVNYANREYSGGDFACQVQGVYSTFYVAGELPMAALVAWASYSRCATGVFPARLGPSVVGIYAQAIVCVQCDLRRMLLILNLTKFAGHTAWRSFLLCLAASISSKRTTACGISKTTLASL